MLRLRRWKKTCCTSARRMAGAVTYERQCVGVLGLHIQRLFRPLQRLGIVAAAAGYPGKPEVAIKVLRELL